MGDLTRGHTYADSGTGANVNAANLHNLVDEAVVKSNAVTTAKILDAAVSTAKIATGAVTNDRLGADAVDGDKIADASIGLEHFAPDARPITYDFGHATDYRRGHRGLVPAPVAGERLQFLRADGWQSIVPQVTETVDAAVQVSPAIAHYNNATFS